MAAMFRWLSPKATKVRDDLQNARHENERATAALIGVLERRWPAPAPALARVRAMPRRPVLLKEG